MIQIVDFLLSCSFSYAIPDIRGGYSIYPWVGGCGPAPHTLTLFKTKIADFPTLFKTLYVTQNHILCKTIINKHFAVV